MKQPAGYEACTGCGVCLLSCPVWRQERDVFMTICGRALALQGGASHEELSGSVFSCLLCGACLAVCPSHIDTVGITLGLRSGTTNKALSPSFPNLSLKGPLSGKRVFLPGKALSQDQILFEKVLSFMDGVAVPDTHADVIADAFKNSKQIHSDLIDELAVQLSGVRTIIAAEGLLHYFLKTIVPGARVMGLGEALLDNPSIAAAPGPGDLYVIEPRGFHADFRRLVIFYDALRRTSRCEMNLDLQRSAIGVFGSLIASGAKGLHFDPLAQARWILEGRSVTRVIVEDIADIAPFRQVSAVPVIHLAEIVQTKHQQNN